MASKQEHPTDNAAEPSAAETDESTAPDTATADAAANSAEAAEAADTVDTAGTDDASISDGLDTVIDLTGKATHYGADTESQAGADSAEAGITQEESDALAFADPAAMQAQLTDAEEKAASYWEQLLRLKADLDNERKRHQKQMDGARKYAVESIVNELLPVKDSLEMGLQAAQGDDADLVKIVEGSELTLKMFGQVFEKNNIVEINPLDQKFNPEFHQAMQQQAVEGKEPNTVIGVLQKGYTLNDRLIRPALVMVAK